MALRKLACALAIVVLCSTPVAAQLAQPPAASLKGQARTPNGLAVPGATLRVVELSTGRSWVTWTDENGNFDLPGLPLGRYQIEAELLGFAPLKKSIELAANTVAPMELVLRVVTNVVGETTKEPTPGASPEKEKQAAAAPHAENRAGVPGERGPAPPRTGEQRPGSAAQPGGFQRVDLNGQRPDTGLEPPSPVDEGPLGQASSSDSFLISGTVGRGVTAGGTGAMFAGLGQFGGRGEQSGVSDAAEGGNFPGQQGGGDEAEGRAMRILQRVGRMGRGQPPQRGNARGGNSGGGRSGRTGGEAPLWGLQRLIRQRINRLHFGFYNDYGNSALDARPYSLTENDPAKIATWRERFGANLGGPLRIPHVYDGRDRTFFFVNYQLARSRNPVDTFATVPTEPERSGDFTDRGAVLFDPQSNLAGPRTSFGSSIPQNRLDAAALGLLQFIPLPNLPGLAQNFHLQTRVPQATDSVNLRVLHTISARLNVQVAYHLQQSRSDSVADFPALTGNQNSRGQNVTLGLTQNWTQRFLNDTRMNFSRNRVRSLNGFAFEHDVASALGITGTSTDPINFGVPRTSLTNFTGLNDPIPALQRNQTLRLQDSVSYSLAKHTLRAGAEFRRMQINTLSDPNPRGTFTFTGLMTSQLDASGQPVPGTGFDFADFLLGLPQSTHEQFGNASTYFRSWGFVGYFQDDWHVHPSFTLNWGLRYEAMTPPSELFGHIANLDVNADFTQVGVVIPGETAPFSGSLPRSLLRGDYNNWAPRIGIAWRPPRNRVLGKRSLVVRAGYGVFYNSSIYNQLAASMANQPPFAQAQTLRTSATEVLTLENGFPPSPPDTARNTVAVDPNYRVGYAQIWNFAVETELPKNINLEITYTGTKGTHLDLLRAPNRLPPGSPLGSNPIADALGFTYDTFGASSIYHALQVSARRRMRGGLMFQGIYTFGKSLDNASSIGGGAPVVVQDDTNFALERGLSSFDIRHQFRGFYFYELPFGERKRWARRGWAAALMGNFRLSGNVILSSGTPFTARVLGSAADNSGTGGSFSTRADQVGDASLPVGKRTPLHYFNTAAFVVPPPGRFGDAARNTIPGPGSFSWNLGLARSIPFGQDGMRRLDLRWEINNLTNTPNFIGLSTVVNSATYGRVTGAGAMRTMSFVARVNF